MPKSLTVGKRNGGIVPRDESGMLLSVVRMREFVKTAKPYDRRKMLAFLSTVYTKPQMIEMLEVSESAINRSRRLCPEIIEAAMLGRNMAIAGMTERRVIELLQKMDVDRIPDDKKPQAVKYLMDSGAIAHEKARPPEERDEGSVMELVFKVKQKMQKAINVVGEDVEDDQTQKDKTGNDGVRDQFAAKNRQIPGTVG